MDIKTKIEMFPNNKSQRKPSSNMTNGGETIDTHKLRELQLVWDNEDAMNLASCDEFEEYMDISVDLIDNYVKCNLEGSDLSYFEERLRNNAVLRLVVKNLIKGDHIEPSLDEQRGPIEDDNNSNHAKSATEYTSQELYFD